MSFAHLSLRLPLVHSLPLFAFSPALFSPSPPQLSLVFLFPANHYSFSFVSSDAAALFRELNPSPSLPRP